MPITDDFIERLKGLPEADQELFLRLADTSLTARQIEQKADAVGHAYKADETPPAPAAESTPADVSAAAVDDTNDTGFTAAELEQIGKAVAKYMPQQEVQQKAAPVDFTDVTAKIAGLETSFKATIDTVKAEIIAAVEGDQPRQNRYKATDGTNQVVGVSENEALGGQSNHTQLSQMRQWILDNSQQGG